MTARSSPVEQERELEQHLRIQGPQLPSHVDKS